MTVSGKKQRELYFAEKAAGLLGEPWAIASQIEAPDFLITCGASSFGLEVSEIFTGSRRHGGSRMKENESKIERHIGVLRQQYEAASRTPLSVRFLGRLDAHHASAVVIALLNENFSEKPVGYRKTVEIEGDSPLHITVTRSINPHWIYVDHRVGWVDHDALSKIERVIALKSKKLDAYRKTAGDDVRLLLVADRTHNSGKVRLNAPATVDTHGFRAVYFMSYPEAVSVFKDGATRL